jgi:cytochrome c556
MKSARIAAAAALALTVWGVAASPAPAETGLFGPSPEEQVRLRQSGMGMVLTSVTLLRGGSANAPSVKNLEFPAQNLANWARTMPALFGPATRDVLSRALPAVFENQADFAAKAAVLADGAQAMADAAKADDKEAFAAALASTRASCKGCHDSYQAPPPPPPKAD